MAFEDRHPDDLAFPRQTARTQGFSLGLPRDLSVSSDGTRVVFLRSKASDDPVTCLWELDVATGEERCVFDPHDHGTGEPPGLTAAERARRERMRERASGVTAFSLDEGATKAAFVESGRLLVVDLDGGDAVEVATSGVPDDPRLSPSGRQVAYVLDGAFVVHDLGGDARILAADDDPDVTFGLAEFIASEEMDRHRGYWWSPDGSKIAVCRVDERPVAIWWLSEPTTPADAPRSVRYPHAGTANAIVTLHVVDVATAAGVDVSWDRGAFEYLARVEWTRGAPLTILVQSRDQRSMQLLEVDAETGSTSLVREDRDDAWIELVGGSPLRLADGTLVSTEDRDDARRLRLGAEVSSPPGMHVTELLGGDGAGAWFAASTGDPMESHVYRVAAGGEPERISEGPGIHEAVVGGGTLVLRSFDAEAVHPVTVVHTPDGRSHQLGSSGEQPVVDPRPVYARFGTRELSAALVLPHGYEPDAPLPVLLSPYGGPHVRMVVRHRGAFLVPQYFADRLGAAVLVIDGRGMAGRSVSWEKAVHGNFSITLDDQVDGLVAAAERWPFLDTSRVAIRGWSFGGELAALAVLKRPDVFHAAIAGAPVSDQRLYDTHYSERYLGDPRRDPEPYRRSALLTFVESGSPTPPLLLIHGFADDNVFIANTLQLSAALFARAYPHELVLLPNASHMGGVGDLVAARYLTELDFLRRSLGLAEPS